MTAIGVILLIAIPVFLLWYQGSLRKRYKSGEKVPGYDPLTGAVSPVHQVSQLYQQAKTGTVAPPQFRHLGAAIFLVALGLLIMFLIQDPWTQLAGPGLIGFGIWMICVYTLMKQGVDLKKHKLFGRISAIFLLSMLAIISYGIFFEGTLVWWQLAAPFVIPIGATALIYMREHKGNR